MCPTHRRQNYSATEIGNSISFFKKHQKLARFCQHLQNLKNFGKMAPKWQKKTSPQFSTIVPRLSTGRRPPGRALELMHSAATALSTAVGDPGSPRQSATNRIGGSAFSLTSLQTHYHCIVPKYTPGGTEKLVQKKWQRKNLVVFCTKRQETKHHQRKQQTSSVVPLLGHAFFHHFLGLKMWVWA